MSRKVLRQRNAAFTLEPDGYFIHTFELSQKLTKSEWNRVKDYLYTSQQNYKNTHKWSVGWIYPDKHHKDEHICLRYSKYGIRIRIEHNESESGYLGILMPKKENIHKIQKSFRGLFKDTPIENRISHYYLSRIDLCVNIRCSNKKVFRELVRVLHKTNIPKKYKRKKYIHVDKKRANKYNKHYIQITCNLQELVIYNKTYQLDMNGIAKKDKGITNGVLRVEGHYWRNKIKKLEKDYEIDDPLDTLWLLMKESKKRILKVAEKYYGDFPYYGIDDIIKMINQSKFRSDTKSRMCVLAKQMQQRQSLDKALQWMENHEYRTNGLLSNFHEIAINPVPLRKDFAAERMPSLLEILHTIDEKPIMVQLTKWKWK